MVRQILRFLSQSYSSPWCIAVLIVLGLETFLSYDPFNVFWPTLHQYTHQRLDKNVTHLSQYSLLQKQSHNRILLIGSSQVREGFDAGLLQELLQQEGVQGNVMNVAASGADLTLEYGILDLPLDESTMLVLGHTWAAYLSPWRRLYHHDTRIHSLSRFLAFSEAYGFYRSIRVKRPQIYYFLVNQLSPSFVIGEEVLPILQRALWQEPPEPYFFPGLSGIGDDREKTLRDLRRQIDESGKRASYRVTLLRRIFKEIHERDIRVLALDLPIAPSCLEEVPELKVIYPRHVAEMKQFSKEYTIPYLTLDKLPEFPDSYFWDCTHTNRIGRDILTRFIAREIARIVPHTSQ